MALPQIKTPLYTTEISTGESVTYRGFTVKEERILLQATKSTDDAHKLLSVKQVINNCTFGKLDTHKISATDITLLLIRIRSKSMGEMVNLNYKCAKPDENGKACGGLVTLGINLDDITLTTDKVKDNKIMLDDTVGVVLKQPTLDVDGDDEFGIVQGCIESVYDLDGGLTYLSECTSDEALDFVDSIPTKKREEIIEYFESLPKIEHTEEYACPKCGHKDKIVLRNLTDFFM